MKKFNTKTETKALIADFNAGVLTKKELMVKYNYTSINSLNSTLYRYKNLGLVNYKEPTNKINNRRYLTEDEKISLLKDYNSKKYKITDLANKYNFSEGGTYNVISRFKKKGLYISKVTSPKAIVAETTAPKIAVKSIRTIHFPDGFTIQIEKAFISGVLIHENGNITIIK